MDKLVITTLQEGRIEGAERAHAFGRKTGRERHRMLFGNADIEHPVREACLHLVEAGSGWHRRGDGDNPVIGFGRRHQALCKDRGVAWRIAGGFLLRAGDDIEFRHRMILFGRRAREGMSLSFSVTTWTRTGPRA